MDAFFASVEQLDFPEYRGKPVAVGGSSDRGVVAAASYEARKYGVKSAMSSRLAAKLCPDLIFARPRFERYKEISYEVRKIFQRYTDLIEPLSMDEAFLDVSENKINLNSATLIAQSIKNDIKSELNLIASAGVSYNKFLAKMASDQDKPNGLFVIEPKDAQDFLFSLPIHRFFGVGKVTADKMLELGIPTGKQLHQKSMNFLTEHFGKFGKYLYYVVRGEDNRPVDSYHERKSLAMENTFFNEIHDSASLFHEADRILEGLWKRYEKSAKRGRTLTLKLKYNDFTISSKSQTFEFTFEDAAKLKEQGLLLLEKVLPLPKPIRLMGFQLSGFVHEREKITYKQTTLDF